MTPVQYAGVACLAYALVCFVIGGLRPQAVWKIGKIQAFVSLLGERGAQALIVGWGLVVGGVGGYLLAVL